eukprot:8522430-Pyramimonas_sp.AAC.2
MASRGGPEGAQRGPGGGPDGVSPPQSMERLSASHCSTSPAWTFVTPGKKLRYSEEDSRMGAKDDRPHPLAQTMPYSPSPRLAAEPARGAMAETMPLPAKSNQRGLMGMSASLQNMVSESVNQLNLVMASDPMACKSQVEPP